MGQGAVPKLGQGKLSESEYIQEREGMYVIDLAEERDGVPFYGSFFQDRNAFRAEYLRDCVEVLGESLALEAWQTKLAHDALDYGNRLMAVADKIAAERGLLHLKDEYYPPDAEEESVEKQLHVVYSLAKWLIFYGGNGHGWRGFRGGAYTWSILMRPPWS